MTESHRHCQCDNCSGIDCGQNDPDAWLADKMKEEDRLRNSGITELLDIIKSTDDEVCGAYGFWEMNSDECISFGGNCTLCKVTKAVKMVPK